MHRITLMLIFSMILLSTPSLVYADTPLNESPTLEPTVDVDLSSPPHVPPVISSGPSDEFSTQGEWELEGALLSISMSNKSPFVGEYVDLSCEFKRSAGISTITPLLTITNEDSNNELFSGDHTINLRFNTTQEISIVCATIMVRNPNNPIVQATYVFHARESEDFEDEIDLVDDDSTSRRGGCNDCTPPTLGYDSVGVKKVDNGVCINDSCMDGSYFHTDYPMQSTLLYFPNTISLKYYENNGSYNIKLVQLGIGVDEIGSSISESQVLIEVWLNNFSNDIYNPSIKEIIVIDPDEILQTANANVKLVKCMDDNNATCLKVDFNYSYAKAPNSPILMSNAIDIPRNTINNYFNDGLNVIDGTIYDTPEIVEAQLKECHISNVQNRNNPCQFLPLVNAEIQRAQDYFDQFK